VVAGKHFYQMPKSLLGTQAKALRSDSELQ